MTTHFSPIGYEYGPIEPLTGTVLLGTKHKPGGVRVVREYRHPSMTLCGLPVARGRAAAAVTPLDHPEVCPSCLRALPQRPTDRVQPVRL